MLNNYSDSKISKSCISFSITVAIQSFGAKVFKRLMSERWDGDHPERLNRKLAEAAKLADGLPVAYGIVHVDAALKECKLITRQTLANYKT